MAPGETHFLPATLNLSRRCSRGVLAGPGHSIPSSSFLPWEISIRRPPPPPAPPINFPDSKEVSTYILHFLFFLDGMDGALEVLQDGNFSAGGEEFVKRQKYFLKKRITFKTKENITLSEAQSRDKKALEAPVSARVMTQHMHYSVRLAFILCPCLASAPFVLAIYCYLLGARRAERPQ